MQSQKPHIIVIGAGLSGLTAARQILKLQSNIQVTVLQANDYLGGRTKSIILNDCQYDLGAQFIGRSQEHIIQLAHQSNNELITVQTNGKKITDLQQGFGTYTGQIPTNVSFIALIEMQLALMKINRMARKVPTTDPRNCPLGFQWDAITAQSWIQKNISSMKVRVMIEAAMRVVLGVQLCEISFLYMLYYVHQSRDFQNLINTENGLQQKYTKKGTQHFSIFLGEEIDKKGGKIRLNFFVKNIKQQEGRVIVTNNQGQSVIGTYLIVALPPPMARKIQFYPPLTVQRRMFCERTFMGAICKVILLYPESFWKNKNFSGQILSDCHDGPAMIAFDHSQTKQNGQVQNALIVFVGGAVYRYWKEKNDFQRCVTEKLAEFLKEPKMLHPTTIKWHAWDNVLSIGGGPVACCPPGVLSQMEDLRKPEGRIHWAGTQMATVSTGFMDGAVESGKRVAKQILNRLSNPQTENQIQEIKQQDSIPPYAKYNRPSILFMNKIFQWW